MICQATYDSLDAVPEALREEFHQVGAKWQLKDTAVPGVGQLFNSALAANETKAVNQVKKRNERILELENELTVAKDKLAVIDIPGHKVLSKEDSALFDDYAKLGTPKEIETKLAKLPTLEQAVEKQQATESLGKVAIAAAAAGIKLNPEVLADWAVSPEAKEKGITFFVKTVEQLDTKGTKVNVEVPHVRIEEKDGDKTKVSERELLPFAKEVLPEWKYNALTNTEEGSKVVNGDKAKAVVVGVKIPNLESAQNAAPAGGDKKRPVEIANEERAKRPSPFATPLMANSVGGAIGKIA